MNIRKYRSQFKIYVVDSDSDRRLFLTDMIKSWNYQIYSFVSWSEAGDEIPFNPPHFLIVSSELIQRVDLENIFTLSPETLILLLVPSSDDDKKYYSWMHQGLYAVVNWPLVDPVQLISLLDHGAEKTYLKYQNEMLMERRKQEDISRSPTPPLNQETESTMDHKSKGVIWEQIRRTENINSAVDKGLNFLFQISQKPVFFFKYFLGRRTLFLAQGAGVALEKYGALGIDFNHFTENFSVHQLLNAEPPPLLQEMMEKVLDCGHLFSFPLLVRGELKGLILYSHSTEEGLAVLRFLEAHYECLSLRGKIHDLEMKDQETKTWKKEFFDDHLRNELARSRRIQLPLSLVRIKVDQFNLLKSNHQSESLLLFWRSLADLVSKYSRRNDILGRLSEDEMGLILPHTSNRGAAIKSERLRRIIASADFSTLLMWNSPITVSIGVSEYPSCCNDAEELYRLSDEALQKVRTEGGNKVGLMTVPAGFVPDFTVVHSNPLI